LAPFVVGLVVGCGGRVQAAAPSGFAAASALPADTTTAHDDDVAEAARVFELSEAEAAALDPRTTMQLHRRALPLLVTELQQLEMLLRATSRGSWDSLALSRRVAEDYVELAAVADAEADAAHARGDAATARARRTIARQARRRAISSYGTLIEQPPRTPNLTLDEVRWFLALECARAGDVANARRHALNVVAEYPNSNYVPRAYFLFGALFAAEASGDPSKHTVAEQAFAKAAASHEPTLRRVALLRLQKEADAAGDTTSADDAARRLASPDVESDARLPTGVTAATPARPATPPPGCTMDVQCKGDRICRDGKCVDL
jgi:TolA-binding protein